MTARAATSRTSTATSSPTPTASPGFPNIFSPTAAQSLGYAATMLEAGVPVVYLYIADAHDRNPLPLDPVTNRPPPPTPSVRARPEYVAQLKAYDAAFGKFFARLAADGITKDNTLFVVVPDENDHFVGSQPTPVGCDGVHVPCTYAFAARRDQRRPQPPARSPSAAIRRRSWSTATTRRPSTSTAIRRRPRR